MQRAVRVPKAKWHRLVHAKLLLENCCVPVSGHFGLGFIWTLWAPGGSYRMSIWVLFLAWSPWSTVVLHSSSHICCCHCMKFWYVHRAVAQGDMAVPEGVKPAGMALQSCWGGQTASCICCFGSSPQSEILPAWAWTRYWRELLGGGWIWSGSKMAIIGYGCSWFQCLNSLLEPLLFIWVKTHLEMIQKGVPSLELPPRPGICAGKRALFLSRVHGSSKEDLFVPSQGLNGAAQVQKCLSCLLHSSFQSIRAGYKALSTWELILVSSLCFFISLISPLLFRLRCCHFCETLGDLIKGNPIMVVINRGCQTLALSFNFSFDTLRLATTCLLRKGMELFRE